MKKCYKVLSLILSALLLFSAFSVIAFADDACVHEYQVTVVPPTCADQGYNLHVCPLCGDFYKDTFTNPLGHIYGSWIKNEEKPGTCTEEGEEYRICSRCNSFDYKTVPAGHKDENNDSVCDVCGENMKQGFIFIPWDWLVSLWNAIVEWFSAIFR